MATLSYASGKSGASHLGATPSQSEQRMWNMIFVVPGAKTWVWLLHPAFNLPEPTTKPLKKVNWPPALHLLPTGGAQGFPTQSTSIAEIVVKVPPTPGTTDAFISATHVPPGTAIARTEQKRSIGINANKNRVFFIVVDSFWCLNNRAYSTFKAWPI